MCGIAGILTTNGKRFSQQLLDSMRSALQHRGPDDEGEFIDETGSVGLVHTRLAIIDLSSAGHQPMHTPDGRFTIVFNGEIYNYQELRCELLHSGTSLHSDSDTEVLLQLYARDGAGMLQQLQGMFAFAIWDRDRRSLFMARDPLGIKPLYYWLVDGQLAFASELRSLLAAKLSQPVIDRNALARFLLMGSVQEPDTLVQGIRQLPAGHQLTWQAGHIQEQAYWKPHYVAAIVDESISRQQVRSALDDSIRRHFVSDVPVGIFLSGGIDSTAVVALARANDFHNLQTFCISFDEQDYNEGDVAAQSAKHFGTAHHDWRMTAADGGALLEDFLGSLDLPSNDGFNTYCVSKLAHDQGLKVVLSGLGGDELFGGYPSFNRIPALMRWHDLARLTGPLRGLAAGLLGLSGRPAADRIAAFLRSSGGAMAAYWTTRSFFTPDEAWQVVADLTGKSPDMEIVDVFEDRGELPHEPRDLVAFLEASLYMRNQLLRDSDVMSMAHGLELRVPLVDRRLMETINQLAPGLRYRTNKQQLLDAVPEVPQWVYQRPKRGFRFPFESWVRRQWSTEFSAVQAQTQVPLGSWYRQWTLFTLQAFLNKNRISLA